jgi:RNA polymerase-interacting CarD/CdnL/TRCF family regulator
MKDLTPKYSLGDMVVHRYYGVGQIEGIELKPLNGVEAECFKVKTENGIYWFPTNTLENPRVHPVASQELIQRAIKILRSAPQILDNDPNRWKERIDDVQTAGDILAISILLRDLAAMKTQKKLNQTQDQAFTNLEDRFLREWSASSGDDVNSIRPLLKTYLQESFDNIQPAT